MPSPENFGVTLTFDLLNYLINQSIFVRYVANLVNSHMQFVTCRANYDPSRTDGSYEQTDNILPSAAEALYERK